MENKIVLEDEEAVKKHKELTEKGLILFEAIVGSQAYGTNLPTSDIDKKFIYIEPLENILSGNITEQINVSKDYVGYEIGRYLDLIKSSNPNLIELISTPADTIIYCHPLFKKYIVDNAKLFLTKQTKFSFGAYAASQIQKARGLNKKIVNPMEGPKKGLLDFCYITWMQGSVQLKGWLEGKKILPEMCGVVAIEHMKNCFHLFVDKEYYNNYNTVQQLKNLCENLSEFPKTEDFIHRLYTNRKYKGITDKDDVQIVLSSVEKDIDPDVMFYCNIEGFQRYCKEYASYQTWLKERNEERYQQNMVNGAQYDCYLDDETEFLTDEGWKKYDEITEEHKLGTIRQNSNDNFELKFENFIDRHKSIYNGKMYTYENRYTRFTVTPNHNLFCSPFLRKGHAGGTNYNSLKANWSFESIETYFTNKIKNRYILNLFDNNNEDNKLYNDDFLLLAGGFLSDGTIGFDKNKYPKYIAIQQKKGSELASEIEKILKYKIYKYESLPEYPVYHIRDEWFCNTIFSKFNHGSYNKRIPFEFLTLSKRQFGILLRGMILGDGEFYQNGSAIYRSNNGLLIDDLQLLLKHNGISSQKYRYHYENVKNNFSKKNMPTYQLYISKEKNKFLPIKQQKWRKQSGWKEINVSNKIITCFTITTGVLITRNNFKIAIQGNSKNLMHCHRLLDMAIEILRDEEVIVRRPNREQLLEIRAGKYPYELLVQEADEKLKLIDELYLSSELPEKTDQQMIFNLLLNLRKEFYNSLK